MEKAPGADIVVRFLEHEGIRIVGRRGIADYVVCSRFLRQLSHGGFFP